MSGKILLPILVLSFLIAIYRIIRTVLVEQATSHGMSEHDAQKRYESLFSILWYKWKDKRKKKVEQTEKAERPTEGTKEKAVRRQTRFSSLPRREQ